MSGLPTLPASFCGGIVIFYENSMDTTIMPQNLQGASAARSGSPLVAGVRSEHAGRVSNVGRR